MHRLTVTFLQRGQSDGCRCWTLLRGAVSGAKQLGVMAGLGHTVAIAVSCDLFASSWACKCRF
eukprot:5235226-Lingulodinium_polyedra.AAC.2